MKVISRSFAETIKIGKGIAKNLKKGDIICLFGELGSGKTTLTKGLAAGLGVKIKDVLSPSFVLIREFPNTRLPLYHFDLYRLKKPEDISTLGYEEYFFADAVTVIEWADRLKYLLPGEFLKVELVIKENNERLLKFTAFGKRYKELLSKIYAHLSH